jgi:hypothetical protein
MKHLLEYENKGPSEAGREKQLPLSKLIVSLSKFTVYRDINISTMHDEPETQQALLYCRLI